MVIPIPKMKLVMAPMISSTSGASPARKTRSLASVPASPVTEKAPTIRPTPANNPASSASAAVIPRSIRSRPRQLSRCLDES